MKTHSVGWLAHRLSVPIPKIQPTRQLALRELSRRAFCCTVSMAEALDLRGTDHFYPFRLLPGDIPRFWPRWAVMDRAYMVLATYDGSWTVTPYPGTNSYTTNQAEDASYVWRSGCIYGINDSTGLFAALGAAGYNVNEGGRYIETYIDEYSGLVLGCT